LATIVAGVDELMHRDRVVVVTGAALGIGQAVSRGLAHRGAIVGGIDPRDTTETAEFVGESLRACCVQLSAATSSRPGVRKGGSA
jgi:NAD(P)-dependent dehydrogenase (short-subunit alcohol dehydrogenase family)